MLLVWAAAPRLAVAAAAIKPANLQVQVHWVKVTGNLWQVDPSHFKFQCVVTALGQPEGTDFQMQLGGLSGPNDSHLQQLTMLQWQHWLWTLPSSPPPFPNRPWAGCASAHPVAHTSQGWPSHTELGAWSSHSWLGNSAKMSYLATWRLSDSGFTLAVTCHQDSVQQEHLQSHCSCASSLDAQPKQASWVR